MADMVRIEMEDANGEIQTLRGAEAQRWLKTVNDFVARDAVRFGHDGFPTDFKWEKTRREVGWVIVRIDSFYLTFIVKPAEDLPGQWVIHCLELDVVSQGNDACHAIRMGLEAAEMVLIDDMTRGADPMSRRAPEEFWEELKRIQTVSP